MSGSYRSCGAILISSQIHMLSKERSGMKKTTIIRIVTGVCMIALAVVLGIILDGTLTGPQSQMWQRMLYMLVVFGMGASGLGGIFGRRGFLYGLICVLAILLLSVPEVLPEPWNRYTIVAGLAALFIWLAVNNSKKKSPPEPEEEPEEELAELTVEEQQELEKYSSLIIVDQPTTGRLFQLIPDGRELRAYRVGGELRGVDVDLLQTGDQPLRPLGEKDFSISTADIRSVRLTALSAGWTSCMAVVKTRSKSYRLSSMITMSPEDYAAFWKSVVPGGVQVIEKGFASEEQQSDVDRPAPDEKRLRILNVVKICFGVYLGAVNLAWLFLNVPYALFSVLSIAAFPVLLALYFCFPKELTMGEKESGKISLMLHAVLAGIVPALRTLIDFNFIDGGKMFWVCAAAFVLLMALFLLLSKEWKTQKAIILALGFVLLYYSLGAVGQLNFLLDSGQHTVEQGIITHMRESDDNDHYITVTVPSGEEYELRIGEKHFGRVEIGDIASVRIYSGAFDIPYAEAQER